MLVAEQGYELAQYNMGNMYFYGLGVEKDTEQAIKWYQLAAKQNYQPAIQSLADLSETNSIER